MKIALITSLYPPHIDGVGDYTRHLAGAMAREGCTVLVICKKTRLAPHEDTSFRVVEAGVRWDARGYRAVEHILREERPDAAVLQYVPHGFEPRGLPVQLGYHITRWARVAPLAIFFHEVRVRWRWAQPGSWVGAGVEHLLARQLCRHARAVMTSIPAYADLLPGRPLIVPVGANIETGYGPDRQEPALATRLLAFGHRDYRALHKAVGRVQERVPGLSLLVCGKTPKMVPLPGMRYTGALPEEALGVRFREAQLFVLADGAGGSALKSGSLAAALCAGLPIVGVQGPLSAAPLSHGHNIWLADGASAEALEAAILHLVERPALRRHLGAGARRLWVEALQWSDIAKQQLAHIRQTIGR